MTLSVCCMFNDPAERVTAILQQLRPVADEIVVAADSRVDEATLGPVDDLADSLYRFDFRPPVDRPRAWLASCCTSDWLFWIDGDEVPSPALVRALPDLTATPGLVQVAFTRRWLFPDAGHWLDECPWWPDFQIRLVRNDDTTMWFGQTHEPFGLARPARYVDAPLYHLSPLTASLVERRGKAQRYDDERPGMVSPAGGPFNDVLLRPERYATRRPQPVPDEDRVVIDRVLGAAPFAVSDRAVVEAPVVPPEVIDARAPSRTFRSEAYRAALVVVERDLRLEPGLTRPLVVEVHNRGIETWPWGWHHPVAIYVSYHWRDADGSALVHDGLRTPLPQALAPGEVALVPVDVAAPADVGRYVLELDLVHEGVTWFDAPTAVEVLVAPRWRRHDPALGAESSS